MPLPRPTPVRIALVFPWFLLAGCLAPLAIPTQVEPADVPIDLGQLDLLATTTAEPLPTELRVIETARWQYDGWQLGEPQKPVISMAVVTMQVVSAMGHVYVALAHPKSRDKELTGEGGVYDESTQASIIAAMQDARAIVVTHEHFDHVSAFAEPAQESLRKGPLLFSARQAASKVLRGNGGFTDAQVAQVKTYEDGPHAIAPGVAVAPIPGHSEGSQLVYVRLANGRKFLLVGDVAWREANWKVPQGKPRLIHSMLGEDGEAMAKQLRWMHTLATTTDVVLVSAHDGEQHDRLVAEGLLGRGPAQ